jgi:hypothetical protein
MSTYPKIRIKRQEISLYKLIDKSTEFSKDKAFFVILKLFREQLLCRNFKYG